MLNNFIIISALSFFSGLILNGIARHRIETKNRFIKILIKNLFSTSDQYQNQLRLINFDTFGINIK